MKVPSVVYAGITAAFASVCSSYAESRAEKAPETSSASTSISNGVFTSHLEDLHQGIKAEDQRFYADGTIVLTYTGKGPFLEPIDWSYSLCFGEPVKDDAKTACVAGGSGTTLEKLVQGKVVRESFHLKTRTPMIATNDRAHNPEGLKSPRGYVPHITLKIGNVGTEWHTATFLLDPVADYK